MVVYVDMDSTDSIGPILLHHKDLAERLRCDLRAKHDRVNSAKELVNRICSPPNVRKALGRG